MTHLTCGYTAATVTLMNNAIETASAVIKAAESKGASVRTMNRLWKAYFVAVDAAKASGAWL